ncbi:MAG: SHOCT domain-containing protein [Gammaproteobacteria bacterium]|nr:SHOCT domain-containing protein [Gammaproteobacteria bacterium]
MFNHDGWVVFGGMFMWVFWIVLIYLVIKMLRTTDKKSNSSHDESPIMILEKRYARGEINEDEYKHRHKELNS